MVMSNIKQEFRWKFCPYANKDVELSFAATARKPEHPVTPKREESQFLCHNEQCDLLGSPKCKLLG